MTVIDRFVHLAVWMLELHAPVMDFHNRGLQGGFPRMCVHKFRVLLRLYLSFFL